LGLEFEHLKLEAHQLALAGCVLLFDDEKPPYLIILRLLQVPFYGDRPKKAVGTGEEFRPSCVSIPPAASPGIGSVSGSSGSVLRQVGKKGIMVLSRLYAAGGRFGREHLHFGGIHIDGGAPDTLPVR